MAARHFKDPCTVSIFTLDFADISEGYEHSAD
jgi:hypothetical protein